MACSNIVDIQLNETFDSFDDFQKRKEEYQNYHKQCFTIQFSKTLENYIDNFSKSGKKLLKEVNMACNITK